MNIIKKNTKKLLSIGCFLILLSSPFYIKAQTLETKDKKHQFFVDISLDYNFAKDADYKSIDSNQYKLIVDPSSGYGSKEKSQYFTYRTGASYFYQVHKRCKVGVGLQLVYKSKGTESVRDSLTKYDLLTQAYHYPYLGFSPLETTVKSHCINLPFYISIDLNRLDLTWGINTSLYTYSSYEEIFEEESSIEYDSRFFTNYNGFLYTLQLGLSYEFYPFDKTVQVYSNIEFWETYIVQMGFRYRIN